MKSSSYGRKSSLIEGVAVVALLIVPMAAARAGEDLSLRELASRSTGAVLVHVRLGAEPRVDVTGVVQGVSEVKATTDWLGLCLPRERVLRKWLVRYAKWPAKQFWRKGLKQGGYDAVVFVKSGIDGAMPECGVEAMQMRHTSLHPDYEKYLADVKVVLDANRAR